jgi:hypothetical protein
MGAFPVTAQATDDPNVMRFETDRTLNPGAARAFYDSASAESDPVAAEFFAVEGVSGLFIINEFCTVRKDEGAEWSELIPQIESVMRRQWG